MAGEWQQFANMTIGRESAAGKVITYVSRREMSIVEQDNNWLFKKKNYRRDIMQLFSVDTTKFFWKTLKKKIAHENIKKHLQK